MEGGVGPGIAGAQLESSARESSTSTRPLLFSSEKLFFSGLICEIEKFFFGAAAWESFLTFDSVLLLLLSIPYGHKGRQKKTINFISFNSLQPFTIIILMLR